MDQQLPALNFLTVEILTILYPMFMVYKNIFPLVAIIVIIVHGVRYRKYSKYVNKMPKPNLTILSMYIALTIGLFTTKNYTLFGILFGLLQYFTYQYHEKQSIYKYKWIENHIDIPITIASGYMSYIGYKTNNLYLAPFLGDLVYHVLEFFNHYS